jgi:hypothetical protein
MQARTHTCAYAYSVHRVLVCIYIVCTCTHARYKPPPPPPRHHCCHSGPLLPHVTSVSVIASEDVEHPVGRRREAHAVARGGAGAGDEGAGGLEAEEQQEGDEQPAADCACVCVCVCVCVCM